VFFTGRQTNSYEATSAQFPQLFRPFFAANAGIPGIGNVPGEYREIVFSVPAGVGGRFAADNDSFFWGADVNARRNLYRGCNSQADGFIGFRYLHLDEELRISEFARINQFNPAVGLPVGSTMTVSDRFKTDNNFYGGQVGFDYGYQQDRLSVGVRTSVALGSSQECVSVAGSQVVAIAGAAPQAFTGGLLALNSNIGSRSDNRYAVVPEATVRVGYQVTERVKVTAGYDFLYWSNVVRPGDQIDRVIDVNRVPNFRTGSPVVAVHPAPLFNTTDFWAQGITVGAEFSW
jgi:Putative beta barrel porin-7 (BBP7)